MKVLFDNTRHTWEQIKQMYPDQWVYMAHAESVAGNLVSAVVVYACKDANALHEFVMSNRPSLPRGMARRYTGEPIGSEYYSDYNDDVKIEFAEGVL